MSREIEKFRDRHDWPSIERWIEPPPGIICPVCKGDMFLHSNGVTYFCSECKYSEQKRNIHVPLKFSWDKEKE